MYYVLLWLVRLLLLLDSLRLWLLLRLAEDGDVVGGLSWARMVVSLVAIRHEAAIEELVVLFCHCCLDVIWEGCSSSSGVVPAPASSLLVLISSLSRAVIHHIAFIRLILLRTADLIQNICVDMWCWVYDYGIGLGWAKLMMLILCVNTSCGSQVLNVICLYFLTGWIRALHLLD